MPDPARPCRNHLLGALSPEAFGRIGPELRPVHLTLQDVLGRPGMPIGTAYFVESGYVSHLVPLEDGDVAEVGLIGREGFLGLPLLLGSDRTITEALVQGEGTALAIDAAALRRLLSEMPELREHLLLYALAFSTQVMLTAACNGHHVLEQRLARWLLMVHDRVDGDDLVMTHEFLAMMLGVRRAGITVAAGSLQRAGLIHYRIGRVTVLDRPGLEAAACGCHDQARREERRLLGFLRLRLTPVCLIACFGAPSGGAPVRTIPDRPVRAGWLCRRPDGGPAPGIAHAGRPGRRVRPCP